MVLCIPLPLLLEGGVAFLGAQGRGGEKKKEKKEEYAP